MFARLFDKRLFALLMASVLCLAFWQLGRGAYIPTKAWVAQELMQRAWRRAEKGHREPPPWPWADTWPVARLTAPGGEVELIVLEGGSGRTLAFGPGHLGVSVLPGERGNSIIAGHRDTHFRFLQHVRKGESLSVDMPDGRGHLFRVVDIDIVDSRRGSIRLDTETPMLSLVTCYPFNARESGGPMRYVVTAELVY
jgi:sortase A